MIENIKAKTYWAYCNIEDETSNYPDLESSFSSNRNLTLDCSDIQQLPTICGAQEAAQTDMSLQHYMPSPPVRLPRFCDFLMRDIEVA